MTQKHTLPAPLPVNEAERLEALHRYRILDTVPEEAFDRITRIASRLFNTPIALVSLVDSERQWFKSRHGIDATETPRDKAFCAYAVLGNETFVVQNPLEDPRFMNNPLVTDKPGIRFYAGAPLTTPAGFNVGALCIIDTKTHVALTESEKDVLRDLAALVVAELELRVATYKAEEASQAKSEFIANVSHEIRTPMNGIIGMAHLLESTPLNTTQKNYIETINHSARNLLLLLNDVLDFSKIEAGELAIESIPYSIKTTFLQAINVLKPLANEKRIDLYYELDDDIPDVVMGDPTRFTQILTNLVGNAVKFTGYGYVRCVLSYDAAHSRSRCDVIDTGIGIPSDKQAQIFQKFTQGDAAITRKYGGTGLGLAITHKLAKKLGGDIEFTSQEGKGSHFWFYLPAPESHMSLPATPESNPAAGTPKHSAAEKARLLIAEDNPINQMFLQQLLENFGFTSVDLADDGKQAADKVAANHYDLVFMDCLMPVMDGYAATELIRAHEKQHDKPPVLILAMTAKALSDEREHCLRVGMDEYFSKPVDPKKLKVQLEKWFVFKNENVSHAEGSDVNDNLFDLKLLRIVAPTAEKEHQVMHILIKVLEAAIQEMRESSRSEDLKNWRSAAHRIRGSAANLGMNDLMDLCLKAEYNPPDLKHERTELIQQIENQLERVRKYALNSAA